MNFLPCVLLGGLVASHLSVAEENGSGNRRTHIKAVNVTFGEQLGMESMVCLNKKSFVHFNRVPFT